MVWFIAGVMVGGIVGFFFAALLNANRKDD